MIHAFLKFLINTDFACWLNSGIVFSVRYCSGLAMRRLDSSLRSHRAWRSQCQHAYSGLNKTLFASVGPNSHGRSHRRSTILDVVNHLQTKKDISSLGRKMLTRGHRLDGTFVSRSFSVVSAKLSNATNIPPYIVSVRSCSLLLFSFLRFCLVSVFKMICRLCAFVKSSIPHHGVDCTQQPSSHGDISLGLSGFFDQSLPNSLLSTIRVAKSNPGLTESPSECGRTGLCDLSGLGSSGRFLIVGSKSCPEFQGVGIGEPVERSNLGSNDAGPDFIDARNAFKHNIPGREFVTSVGMDNFSSERFPLTLDERNDINEVSKRFPLDVFEQVSVGKEPLLSSGSLEFRAAYVGGMEYRLHTVFGSAESFTELPPVPAEFPQLHQRFVSDEPERTVSSDEPDGNIESIVPVSFSSLPSSSGQFSSIGDVNSFDAVPVSVDEPFDESNCFDSHPSGPGQIVNPVFDFVDTLGVDGQRTDDVFAGIDGSERDSGLVQVDSNERSEVDAGYIPAFGDSLFLFCLNVFHNKFLKEGS